jgi:hypothetical protein
MEKNRRDAIEMFGSESRQNVDEYIQGIRRVTQAEKERIDAREVADAGGDNV